MSFEQGFEVFARGYLALFFTGVAAFYTVRIISRKRAGHGEMVFPGEFGTNTWWAHVSFRFFRAAIWLVCLLRWPWPAVDDYLFMIRPLETAWLQLPGIVVLTAGFMLAIAGHFSLGQEWRSGIDPDGPQKLHTGGLYGLTRNPMFAGVKVAQLGFFLALPSGFSLICLVFGWIAIDKQLRAEEAFLAVRFGERYRHYCRQVPRWFFSREEG